MKNFDEYLETLHANQYMGTDDCMPEDFISWQEGLDTEEILQMVRDYEEKKNKN